MAELKTCPFCGGEAKLVDNSGECYYQNKMTEKPWRVFLRRQPMPVGTRGVVKNFCIFMVTNFKVYCTNKTCIARNHNIYFHSKEEAIEAWNRRAEDVQTK